MLKYGNGVLQPSLSALTSSATPSLEPLFLALSRLVLSQAYPDQVPGIPWSTLTNWPELLTYFLSTNTGPLQLAPQGARVILKFKKGGKVTIKQPGKPSEKSEFEVKLNEDETIVTIIVTEIEITVPWWPVDGSGKRAESLGYMAHEWTHILMYYASLTECYRKNFKPKMPDADFDKMHKACVAKAQKQWGSESHKNPKSEGERLAVLLAYLVESLVRAVKDLSGT